VICLNCKRSLIRYAASVVIDGVERGWGPKCAEQVAERMTGKQRQPGMRRARSATTEVHADPRQMALQFEELCLQ
jgi:hypothetical protein